LAARVRDAGERCLVVELDERIDVVLNRRVHALAREIERAALVGVEEAVPTYRSVAVYYDPLRIERGALMDGIETVLGSSPEAMEHESRVVEIPTVYGGEYGPDLDFVARHAGLTQVDVIRLHGRPLYHVYMLGFTAGFAYLGGLPERLAVPRLPTPRLKVPAGSVGIGGTQTGVYPLESPGGWHIIGRTYLCLFDSRRVPPSPILPGDKVRFLPIDEAAYRTGATGTSP
jgi:inhibitor of KinA